MEKSVREMLDYSKGRQPEYETANLNELVSEIVEEARGQAQANGVELRLMLEERIPASRIDRQRLHDAVLNLISNAIDAHVEARGEGPYVQASTRLSTDRTIQMIEIADNGPGIPEEIAQRVFEPFFSTKGSKGTGLGLAVTMKVAQENGGSLALQTAPGEGTRFTLHLPVV